MELAKIIVEMHGPVADHNMPCAVCRERHAVLDLSTGLMQPCWNCQEYGFVLKRLWWRWLRGPKLRTPAARPVLRSLPGRGAHVPIEDPPRPLGPLANPDRWGK